MKRLLLAEEVLEIYGVHFEKSRDSLKKIPTHLSSSMDWK